MTATPSVARSDGSGFGGCRAVAAAVGVGLLVACGSPTEPGGGPQLHLYTQVVFGFPSLPTTADPRDRSVVVSGLIVTPNTGYFLDAALQVPMRGRLEITVSALRGNSGLPFPSQNYYAATVGRLVPGVYSVRVIHVVERDTQDTTVALDQTVRVR